MTVQQIRQKARKMGLKNITRYRKEHLIRAIQELEGNSPCFRGIHDCWEVGCLWREECQG
jgi:Rho termination factor, N-terminal domain